MSIPFVLHRQTPLPVGIQPQRRDAPSALNAEDLNGRRRFKIWEISPNLHCSVIGTCLTTGELRQLLVRLGHDDARTATDHELHTRGVRAAGQPDVAGKMLNKALDKRHDAVVKRMYGAKSADEVLARWRSALDEGDIPGGYWAAMTHPATSPAVIREVFGEVHMLSHLVGQTNRLDIARLRKLEIALSERVDTVARQEARLRASAGERSELIRKIDALQSELGQQAARAPCQAHTENVDGPDLISKRLAAEKSRSAALAKRVEDIQALLSGEKRKNADLVSQVVELTRELACLERALLPSAGSSEQDSPPVRDLEGLTLLYVGGRPSLIEQLRGVAAARGAALLAHDGGVEDNPALLPGLISQATAAFFPVDCVSHRAAGQLKKLSKAGGKPYVPLRTASLASFVAAIADTGSFSPRS